MPGVRPLIVIVPSAAPQVVGLVNETAVIAGLGYTVAIAVAMQPGLVAYVISAVPAAMPDTMPVPAPTTATASVPLLQVPPGIGLVRVVVPPAQRVRAPPMLPGIGVTVTTFVA